jgi:hypothetical protein
MQGPSWLTSLRDLFSRRRDPRSAQLRRRRNDLHRAEPLEGRRVMAFDFVAAFPNFGAFITEGSTLREAPQQITIRFSPGAKVDPATLGAISVVRAGADGAIGSGDDVNVTPVGFTGLVAVDDFPNENQVVLRFAENLPDDLYRLSISGGLKTLDNGPAAPAESFRNGGSLTVNFRVDLGAQVVSVVPQPITRQANGTLTQARDTVVVHFNANDPLLAASAQTVGNYRLIETDPATGADVAVRIPQSVVYATTDATGQRISRATLTFAGDLGDKLYRLQIGGGDDDNSTLVQATAVGTLFRQPDGTTPGFSTNSFLGDGLAGANDVDLYKVALTAGATLTVRIRPDAALDAALRIFDAAGNQVAARASTGPGAEATLTHTAAVAGEFYVGISSTGNAAYVPTDGSNATDGTTRGGYRLDLSSDAQPAASDENSSFAAATGLGVLGVGGKMLDAVIDVRPTVPTPLGNLLFPTQPGTVDEPGHREIPILLESHLMPAAALLSARAAAVIPYNFQSIYGNDPQGNPLFNAITENQKQRAREVFDLYSLYTGIRFIETAASGITVVTGDIRAVNPNAPVPNGPAGIADTNPLRPRAVMNGSLDWGQSEFRGSWYDVAMHEIGHVLGLGHSYDLESNMGEEAPDENVVPGDYDIFHLSVLYPRNGSDVDTYSFTLAADGKVSLETVVARPGQPVTSLADTVLTLYREDPATGARELVARNDDFYGRDSFIGLDLRARNEGGSPYTYYVTVTSTDTEFDPTVENSGNGGRSDGAYRLRMGFVPAAAALNTVVDAQGTPIDGNRDGIAGGSFDFWFQSSTAANTVFVDKVAPAPVGGSRDGSLARPFTTVEEGLAAAGQGSGKKVVRIVGNAPGSPATAVPYLIGTTLGGQPLPDGGDFVVPANVTVMIDEGAVFKLRAQVIDVGSSTDLVSRRGAALQVLGTPLNQVQFTSYHDDGIGGDSDGVGPVRSGGQWGGIVIRSDADSASERVFLNSISQAVMQYGGGQVLVNGQLQSFAPIHLVSARPTLTFNTIRFSAGAAVSADPNSFEETAGRRGPTVRGNRVTDNSINGLFVRIRTQFGQPIDTLDVPAAFVSRDITYVLAENMLINGGTGGYLNDGTNVLARATGRLQIDAGVVVKLQGSRIELGRGHAQLIAEGDPQNRVIFTSAADNRFGAGGTFDLFGTQVNQPAAGDWGGIVVNAAAQASIDNAYIAYGGGQTSIEGGFDRFNVIETHQGRLRLANSRLENNASGQAATNRTGRGANDAATIFVRGAQPVIIGNDFRSNAGAVISVNVNSLSDLAVPDAGRSTGASGRFAEFDDNLGPLVRGNTLAAANAGGAIGGMVVRGGEVNVESVWDDTDIVHVVTSEIVVDNFHTATGVRLMSRPNASLVVKLRGETAGFTATGHGADIDDRIGGTVQVLGQPGYPVVLTSLADDTVGASRDPLGITVKDTNGDGPSTGTAADWRGLRFLPYSNDRNVSVVPEAEPALTGGVDLNRVPFTAQYLGVLAPMQKGGDDNRRLGFEVHGYVSADDSTDVDVYSFDGYSGSEVWLDIDKTSATLDAMIELLDASGTVLARSLDSQSDAALTGATRGLGGTLRQNAALGEDYYSQNPRDPGMRVVLPGAAGIQTQYFVRVRSQPRVTATATPAELEAAATDVARVRQGATSGRYELRIRLQQRDEKPGSTVRYADIRFPVVGIDVQGLPLHSPLLGENAEAGANETLVTAQNLGNLLATDRNAISVAGALSSATDVDWYAVDLAYEDIQVIGGLSDGLKTWSTVFDIDYADGFRGDLTISVFNAQGQLMYVGRDSSLSQNGSPDQPVPGQGNGFDDLSKGSIGVLDPFIGPAQMPTGTPGAPQRYYVAISSNEQLPAVLDATFNSAATNRLVRLEPITSTFRVVEDHIGFVGYSSGEKYTGNDFFDYTYVPPTSGPLFSLPSLDQQLARPTIDGIQYYLAERQLPGFPDIIGRPVDDLVMRSDGWLYSYVGLQNVQNTAGRLSRESIAVAGDVVIGQDNIPNATPNAPFQEQGLAPTNTQVVVPTTNFQLSTANVTTRTPLVRESLTGTVQYSAVLVPGQPAVTGTWTFTTAANGVLTFRPVGAVDPALQSPTGGSATAAGVVSVTWSANVTVTQTGVVANPTLAEVSYQVVPDPNAVTTDRVEAVAWRRVAPPLSGFDGLFYSVRDENLAGNETGVSRLYRAREATGDATAGPAAQGPAYGRVGNVIQTAGNDLGLTTGMAFMGRTLYGVDDRGHLFTIDTLTAAATLIGRIPGNPDFQGLAVGPQNVAGGPSSLPGYFADKLFAVDRSGTMWCFDTLAALIPAFNSGTSPTRWVGHVDEAGNQIAGNFTGLAFSPIDVNLWRATTVRGAEAGHGVTVALDHTRDAGATVAKGITEKDGHVSVYYGFDTSKGVAADGTQLRQLGVVSQTWAADLQSNIGTSIANLPVPSTILSDPNARTFVGSSFVFVTSTSQLSLGMTVSGPGIPAGATITAIGTDFLGNPLIELSEDATASGSPVTLTFTGSSQTITTLPFSLAGYTYQDKPTLYFNYRIESGAGSTGVQLSTDGGTNWTDIATNKHARSTLDLADEILPAFPSVSSRIGLLPNQLVQELFENTGWRQARIDIGEFAGAADIRLRVNFTPVANANGKAEGLYIDDFIVGFAERGEVVTGANPGQTGFFAVGTPVSFTTPQQNLQGPYQLEIRRGTEFGKLTAIDSPAVQLQPADMIDTQEALVRGLANTSTEAYVNPGSQLRGDDNQPREQGQFIIESNAITSASTYGIRIDAAAREAGTNAPLPGAVRNLPVLNANRLVPGVAVMNNIVSTSGQAGILFSGDPNAGAGATAAVPFGRIVNNTIYGGPTPQGVGVDVRDNAGPTILNNVFASLATGVSVDTTSAATTVVGTSAFFDTATQVSGVASDRPIVLTGNPFVNAAGGNFYPVANTPVIDSSLDVLQERNDYAAVISPLGIPVSPIIAPARDLYGQLRSDDPGQASAPGLGAAVFKDRGAVDRVDFTQPRMSLAGPLDQSAVAPVDRDPALNRVRLERADATAVTRFVLQLDDVGVGLDKSTIVKEAFQVVRDGTVTLVEGVDYLFRFLETSNQVVLESVSVFPLGEYVITATSRAAATGVTGRLTDLANNTLLPNETNGTTLFRIALVDVPAAPLALTGVAGDRQVVLNWQPPATGTAGVIDYIIEVSTDGGSTWAVYADGVSTATTATVTGLTNGTTYRFRVSAVNATGAGAPSAMSAPLTPSAPAAAPTGVVGVPGDAQVALTWSAPADTGGSPLADYLVQYRVNVAGSSWTTFADGTSTATAATVTGLVNGTAYVFRVAAVNAAAAGTYSAESVPVTPRTLPSVPTGLVGLPGDTAVTLNWTAPADGGAAISDYLVEYRLNVVGSPWLTFADGASAATTATVTGLVNGTAYVFRVAAVNAVGTGPATAESAPVTPLASASAPTGLVGTAGDRQVALVWGVPATDGSSPITDYQVQFRTNVAGSPWTTFADATSTALTATVTGLTNGTAYVFRVAAITGAGVGAYTAESAPFTPFTAPAAPTGVSGVAGDRQVVLSWTAPSSDGGVPIKDYVISYTSDGTNFTVFNDGISTATTATVTGLVNGTTYAFRVAAVNTGDLTGPTAQSGQIRPFVLVAAPTGLAAVGQNQQVSLSWVAPAGAAGIRGYIVQYREDTAGAPWQTFVDGVASTAAVVTGLTNGTRYAFRVAAKSDDGPGIYSNPAVATPVTAPAAVPTAVRGSGRSGRITLRWNAPAVNPVAPVTRYVIQYRIAAAGSAWRTLTIQPSATSVVITGLTNRLGYFFRVAGANGAGAGPFSASSARIRPF